MSTTTKSQITAGRGVKLAGFTAAAVIALAWASSTQAALILLEARAVGRARLRLLHGRAARRIDDIVKGSTGTGYGERFRRGRLLKGVGSATASVHVNCGASCIWSASSRNAGNALGLIGQIVDQLTFTAPGVASERPCRSRLPAFCVEGAIERQQQQRRPAGEVAAAVQSWRRGLSDQRVGAGLRRPRICRRSLRDLHRHGHGLCGDVEGLDIELTATRAPPPATSPSPTLAPTLCCGTVISDLTVGGVALNDFTVTSASGTNWANSFVPTGAPEPATRRR